MSKNYPIRNYQFKNRDILGLTNLRLLSTRMPSNVVGKPALYFARGFRSGSDGLDNERYTDLDLKLPKGESIHLDDVKIKVTQTPIVTRTSVNGLGGSVKEYITSADYDLELTCGVADMSWKTGSDRYPVEDVSKLVFLCNRPESIEISCAFLEEIFDIHRIVFTQYIVNIQSCGNRQEVTLKALSDCDYVLSSEQV